MILRFLWAILWTAVMVTSLGVAMLLGVSSYIAASMGLTATCLLLALLTLLPIFLLGLVTCFLSDAIRGGRHAAR